MSLQCSRSRNPLRITMLIHFLLTLQKLFVLLGSLPGEAGQIMKALIEETGTSLPQRNDEFKIRRKIRR